MGPFSSAVRKPAEIANCSGRPAGVKRPKEPSMSENRPPSTLEGAYCLHQLYHIDRRGLMLLEPEHRESILAEAGQVLNALNQRGQREESGACYRVLSSVADLMLMYFRQSPDELAEVEQIVSELAISEFLQPAYGYFSVVELSLHGAAERYHKMLTKQGLQEGTPEWELALEEQLEKERDTQRERLYPEVPLDPYVCFYPMNKKRGESINWFTLTPAQRGELMKSHGRTGRKYYGRVSQIVTSSSGLADYDWGVTLFAKDPVDFKKLVYEMRFDEVSAVYAEFGSFFIGIRTAAEELFIPKLPAFSEKLMAGRS
jgi:chlorite dismutase